MLLPWSRHSVPWARIAMGLGARARSGLYLHSKMTMIDLRRSQKSLCRSICTLDPPYSRTCLTFALKKSSKWNYPHYVEKWTPFKASQTSGRFLLARITSKEIWWAILSKNVFIKPENLTPILYGSRQDHTLIPNRRLGINSFVHVFPKRQSENQNHSGFTASSNSWQHRHKSNHDVAMSWAQCSQDTSLATQDFQHSLKFILKFQRS